MHVYGGGPSSWVAIVTLIGVFGVRMLSSQRRRQGGRPGGMSGFTAQSRPTSSPSPTGGSPDAGPTVRTGFTGTAPGWFVDPFVRHEHRYWSGTGWTEHVMDGGVPGTDPPPAPRT